MQYLPWIKAFHIIFMVCWFACIFYLPRLFVNYAVAQDETTRKQLVVMQRKLFRFSIPFAILTVVFGFWLASFNLPYYKVAGWFHVKMLLVLLLIVYHVVCGLMVKNFSRGGPHRSHVFYRWFNEFPVLILFAVVILAVVKPF